MIISAKVISKPRTIKRCSICGQRLLMGKPRLRLYGDADDFGKPFVIYTHLECVNWGEKIKKAKEEYTQ